MFLCVRLCDGDCEDHDDCSWYASCDLDHLLHVGANYTSAAVKKTRPDEPPLSGIRVYHPSQQVGQKCPIYDPPKKGEIRCLFHTAYSCNMWFEYLHTRISCQQISDVNLEKICSQT